MGEESSEASPTGADSLGRSTDDESSEDEIVELDFSGPLISVFKKDYARLDEQILVAQGLNSDDRRLIHSALFAIKRVVDYIEESAEKDERPIDLNLSELTTRLAGIMVGPQATALSVSTLSTLLSALVVARRGVRAALEGSPRGAGSNRELLQSILDDLSDNVAEVSSRQNVTATRQSGANALSANSAAEEAQEAAGDVSASELSKDFDKQAKSERRSGWFLLFVSASVLAGTAYVEGQLFIKNKTDLSFSESTARAAIALPFLVIAGYLVREALAHWKEARDNRRIAVRLLAVRAYVRSLKEDKAMSNEIRGQLGRAVFTVPGFTPDETKNPLVADLGEIVGKLSEAVAKLSQPGAGQSGSSGAADK